MKNFTMLIFVVLLLSACQKTQTQTPVQSQSGSDPIMGYDKVTWGTSIQDVRRAYGISDTRQATPFPNSNMVALGQGGVSDSILSREFFFLDDKLCQVNVFYELSAFTKQELLTALKVKFGDSTDYEEIGGGTITLETTIFGKYSPELIVVLSRRYNYSRNEEDLTVSYRSQKLIDEYEASKVEL